MEPSGTYGDALRELFQARGVTVYRVSPKRSHDAAEVYDGVPSYHDAKSSGIVAQLHWDGVSEEWKPLEIEERKLAAKVGVMKMYDGQFRRNLNRMEAQLARYWPEVTAILHLNSASLLELVALFGSPGEVALRDDEARTLLRRVGGHLLREEKIDAVVVSARQTIGCAMIEAEREAMQELARETRRNQKELQKARRQVARVVEWDESAFEMSRVIGKVTTAVLISELGWPGNFDSASSYLKGLGLNLKIRQSGKTAGALKITKRGPGLPRKYLRLAVMRLIQRNNVFKGWFDRKVNRDGGKKGKAIVALMRKLAKGLYHVGQGKPFDVGLLFNVKRLGIVPL